MNGRRFTFSAVAAAVLTSVSFGGCLAASLDNIEIVAPNDPAVDLERRVIDGDTFKLGPLRYRLWGIDAPEMSDDCGRCGAWAGGMLLGMLAIPDRVKCLVLDVDRYRRMVVLCGAGGPNINERMVAEGAARAWNDAYTETEAKAVAERAGLWACDRRAPAAWEVIKAGYCPP